MWTKAQELAAQYQSPGTTGIGFATFASTGRVLPWLWDNIEWVERQAKTGNESIKYWADDMSRLRRLLVEEGHEELTTEQWLKRKATEWVVAHGTNVRDDMEEEITEELGVTFEHAETIIDFIESATVTVTFD